MFVVLVEVGLEKFDNCVFVVGVGGSGDDLIDELGVGIDRDVGLVTVKVAVLRFVTMTCFGVDRRDHPVLRNATHDFENPVFLFGEVLAGDESEQFCSGLGRSFELVVTDDIERGIRIAHERVDSASRAARSSQSHGGLPGVA